MTFGFIRVLFILLSTVVGFQLGGAFSSVADAWGLIGAGIGFGVSAAVIGFEQILGKVSLRGLSAAVFGLIFALIVSQFLSNAIDLIPDLDVGLASAFKLVLVLIISYLGMVLAMRGRDEFNLIIPYIKFDRQDQKDTIMIWTQASSSTAVFWISARQSFWKAGLLFRVLF